MQNESASEASTLGLAAELVASPQSRSVHVADAAKFGPKASIGGLAVHSRLESDGSSALRIGSDDLVATLRVPAGLDVMAQSHLEPGLPMPIQATPSLAAPETGQAIPGQVILQFNLSENNPDAFRDAVRQLQATGLIQEVLQKYPTTLNGVAVRAAPEASGALAGLPFVAHAWSDRTIHVDRKDGVPAIGGPAAWNRQDAAGRSLTGRGVTVAVIDTGIDYHHVDLGGCLGAACRVKGGYDFFNDDGDPFDDHSHGTHVAGIIAGQAPGSAADGVAPEAKLLAYKVLGADGSGWTSTVLAGIEGAVDPNGDGDSSDHADIASVSLGGPVFGTSDPLVSAVQAGSQSGVLFVVAAGNNGLGGISSPGIAPNALTVAASCMPFQVSPWSFCPSSIASFSSRGPGPASFKPDIAAPGVEINSTIPGGGYARYSGTSMATPFVSGAAALVKQLHPTWGPLQIKSALMSTGQDLDAIPQEQGSGQARVDLALDAPYWTPTPGIAFGRIRTPEVNAIITLHGLATATLQATSTGPFNATGGSTPGVQARLDASTVLVTPGSTTMLGLSFDGLDQAWGKFHGAVVLQSGSKQYHIPYTLEHLITVNVTVQDAMGRLMVPDTVALVSPDLKVKESRQPEWDCRIQEARDPTMDCNPTASFTVKPGPYIALALGSPPGQAPFLLATQIEAEGVTSVALRESDARTITFASQSINGTPLFGSLNFMVRIQVPGSPAGDFTKKWSFGSGTEWRHGGFDFRLGDMSNLGLNVTLSAKIHEAVPAPAQFVPEDILSSLFTSKEVYLLGWTLRNPGPSSPSHYAYGPADLASVHQTFDFPGNNPNLNASLVGHLRHYNFHAAPDDAATFSFGFPVPAASNRTTYVGGGITYGYYGASALTYVRGTPNAELQALLGSLEIDSTFAQGPHPAGDHLAPGAQRHQSIGAAPYLPFAFNHAADQLAIRGPYLASRGHAGFITRASDLPQPLAQTRHGTTLSEWTATPWTTRTGLNQPWGVPWTDNPPSSGAYGIQFRLPTGYPAPSLVEASYFAPNIATVPTSIPAIDLLDWPVRLQPGEPFAGLLHATNTSQVAVEAIVDGQPVPVQLTVQPGGVHRFNLQCPTTAQSLDLHIQLQDGTQVVWYNYTDAALAPQSLHIELNPLPDLERGRTYNVTGRLLDEAGNPFDQGVVTVLVTDEGGQVLQRDRMATGPWTQEEIRGGWSFPLSVPSNQPRVLMLHLEAPGGGTYLPATFDANLSSNRAPRILDVSVQPEHPVTGDELTATASVSDGDGDAVEISYKWLRNGQPAAYSGPKVSENSTRRGDVWQVQVTAGDGYDETVAWTNVTIFNAPPQPTEVLASPANARAKQALHATASGRDADGDSLSWSYEWFHDGQRQVGLASAEVPAERVVKGLWVVEATPSDGIEQGAMASAYAVVANTPPHPAEARITPANPRGKQPLHIEVSATDVDNDPVTWTFAWFRDGQRQTDLNAADVPTNRTAKNQLWLVEAMPWDGTDAGAVTSASVTVRNSPPVANPVVLLPLHPVRGQALQATVSASDVDGDVVTWTYRWFRDDQLQSGLTGSSVPQGTIAKGEVWRVEATPSDGSEAGAMASASVTVRNTVPVADSVDLLPLEPRHGQALQATVSASDADGDSVTWTYKWLRDGQLRPNLTAASIPQGLTAKGQVWRVEATPSDGSEVGAMSSASVTVRNTRPVANSVELLPLNPVRGQTLHTAVSATDADGDGVTWTYKWFLNDHLQPYTNASLPTGATAKGQVWRVEATPSDGTEAGDSGSASAAVRNTPPVANPIELLPSDPKHGQMLQATTSAFDADGDTVTWTYKWFRNDELQSGLTGASVPQGQILKGEVWRVEATPFDGSDTGAVVSASVTVHNSLPLASSVELLPLEPRHGQALQATASASDADGDAMTWAYKWFRDGQLQANLMAASIPQGLTTKGQVWRVEATPSDNNDAGQAASASVTVLNTPPAGNSLQLLPLSPLHGQALHATATASDVDGDAVTWTYKWFRDNQIQVSLTTASVPQGLIAKGQVWRVEATPSDGTDSGAGVAASVTVQNTLPVAGQVELLPLHPTRGQMLNATSSASDADGDAVTWTYKWFRDNQLQVGLTTASVQQGLILKGQEWRVEATPSDGTAAGSAVSASVTVSNAPPVANPLQLLPISPVRGQALQATASASDADDDAVTWSYAWFKDGQRQTDLTTADVPVGHTAKGQVWRVESTPTDGTDAGTSISASVTVVNAAPVIQSASANPATTTPNTSITFSLQASDPDGDALTVTWTMSDGTALQGLQATGAFAQTGQKTVSYNVSDGHTQATGQLIVTVQAPATSAGGEQATSSSSSTNAGNNADSPATNENQNPAASAASEGTDPDPAGDESKAGAAKLNALDRQEVDRPSKDAPGAFLGFVVALFLVASLRRRRM